MAVNFINEDRHPGKIKRKSLKKWLEDAIEKEGKKTGVTTIVFCSDEYLLKVNKEFLKRDYLTDVISFDYTKGEKISGDILISIERIQENARKNNVSYLEEIKRVMIHGILHLIGYNDNTKEKRKEMTRMEDLYLGTYKD